MRFNNHTIPHNNHNISPLEFVQPWPAFPASDVIESDIEPLPGTCIAEDGECIYVEAALPGIDPKDIEVTFDEDEEILWIRGERKEQDNEDIKYYYKTLGGFSYRVTIPEAVVKTPSTQAISKNGLLTVILTKLPRLRPRKLEVAAG